jgi:hypothetical protein
MPMRKDGIEAGERQRGRRQQFPCARDGVDEPGAEPGQRQQSQNDARHVYSFRGAVGPRKENLGDRFSAKAARPSAKSGPSAADSASAR